MRVGQATGLAAAPSKSTASRLSTMGQGRRLCLGTRHITRPTHSTRDTWRRRPQRTVRWRSWRCTLPLPHTPAHSVVSPRVGRKGVERNCVAATGVKRGRRHGDGCCNAHDTCRCGVWWRVVQLAANRRTLRHQIRANWSRVPSRPPTDVEEGAWVTQMTLVLAASNGDVSISRADGSSRHLTMGDVQFSKLKVTKTTRPLPKCPPADLGFGKVRCTTTQVSEKREMRLARVCCHLNTPSPTHPVIPDTRQAH